MRLRAGALTQFHRKSHGFQFRVDVLQTKDVARRAHGRNQCNPVADRPTIA
jgi:hypothetical protein